PIIDDKVDEQPPIHFPEKMPEPQGGMEGMYEFLRANLKYPQVSQYGIAGTVLVEFVVERDGSISNVTIKAGVHPELDKEAMRVVKMLPKWKPGEQLGKPVRCLYNIPISFIIK
ncbi:MAG: energy transducer TonB, partial [Lentimicrobiaceae bacterium]|nr:energy transducer TonB [Lentimicrobiaceae bacterium]